MAVGCIAFRERQSHNAPFFRGGRKHSMGKRSIDKHEDFISLSAYKAGLKEGFMRREEDSSLLRWTITTYHAPRYHWHTTYKRYYMALYYEAALLLTTVSDSGGSLKSRIYKSTDLKSNPSHLFALISEASKWSPVLKEVIEKSELLPLERKLTPALALLLVHDQLLSKRGIVAPAAHSLKVAITRHKAPLNAEFTKARLRRGFASVEALRVHLNTGQGSAKSSSGDGEAGAEAAYGKDHIKWVHPRWIRVNTILSSLEAQLATTFADYAQAERIEQLLEGTSDSQGLKVLYLDRHIPNLLALPAAVDLSATPAYRKGEIIFQDKASCFPAYLLDPGPQDGDIIDACAAPGNKTTHIAALLQTSRSKLAEQKIVACEKDKARAVTLQKMVDWAGTQDMVKVKAGQDFLRLDPGESAYQNAGALLLDPSCSGSGIVGRDDMPSVVLPSADAGMGVAKKKSKRKRSNPNVPSKSIPDLLEEGIPVNGSDSEKLQVRLRALSTFQLKLIKHAFLFPSARKITYSTCSIHAEENEHVIIEALRCTEARRRGWRILRRAEQVSGMREWAVRGDRRACERYLEGEMEEIDHIAEGCIRCEKGTQEGTMGFFVACFVKDGNVGLDRDTGPSGAPKVEDDEDDRLALDDTLDQSDLEWQGFDDEDNPISRPRRAAEAIPSESGKHSSKRKRSKRVM